MLFHWDIKSDGSSDFSEEVWYGQANPQIVYTVAQVSDDKLSEREDGDFAQEDSKRVLRRVSQNTPQE